MQEAYNITEMIKIIFFSHNKLGKARVVLFYKTISPTVLPASSSSSSPTSSAADRASPPRPTNRGRRGGRCKARNRGRNRSHRSRRTWTGGRRSLNWKRSLISPQKEGGINFCTVSSLSVGPQAAVLVLTIRTILLKTHSMNYVCFP